MRWRGDSLAVSYQLSAISIQHLAFGPDVALWRCWPAESNTLNRRGRREDDGDRGERLDHA
jgi:hypothetical protein